MVVPVSSRTSVYPNSPCSASPSFSPRRQPDPKIKGMEPTLVGGVVKAEYTTAGYRRLATGCEPKAPERF